MVYFKNVELAAKYHISEGTVRNWIKQAEAGKLDLQLQTIKSKKYVSNTPENLTLVEELVDAHKKYRNTRSYEVARPIPEFYELFSRKQILDIINNLDVHHEIPGDYNYFGQGAYNWAAYAERMRHKEGAFNLIRASRDLIDTNIDAIDLLFAEEARVNIIDIGPGNGWTVKPLLEHIHKLGKLHRYIAIDISEEMLHLAERNIKEWFGDSVHFEGYVRDITYERFDDILLDDMLDADAKKTMNLALLFGGTLVNFRNPVDALKTVGGSMGINDQLICTLGLDSEPARHFFDFSPKMDYNVLPPMDRYIFDLLNVDESIYVVEMGFNKVNRSRYIRVRLKKALSIEFEFENGSRTVELNKDDVILLYRVWHRSALEVIDIFQRAGFTLQQSSMSKNKQYLLTITGIDRAIDLGT